MASMIANKCFPKSKIEAVQTVPPSKVTDPRQTRQVLATEPVVGSGILQGCFNVVLYHNKASEEDSGWLAAAWIKESLGRVLNEQPLLSGRLRKGEDGDGALEIVSNDSGARLLEAKISGSLEEFLNLSEKEVAETELVFWKEIDEKDPRLSPLLYVQITNFECGGYSIGISCSLLLADLLMTENFIAKWGSLQRDFRSSNSIKSPIFYLPNLKAENGLFRTISLPSTPIHKNSGQTMLFKIENSSLDSKKSKNLAMICIEEAEKKRNCQKPTTFFTLLVKEATNVIKLYSCEKHELGESELKNQLRSSSWEDLGIINVSFHKSNGPAHVSCWITSLNANGIVMAFPSNEKFVNVVVTAPEMEI